MQENEEEKWSSDESLLKDGHAGACTSPRKCPSATGAQAAARGSFNGSYTLTMGVNGGKKLIIKL